MKILTSFLGLLMAPMICVASPQGERAAQIEAMSDTDNMPPLPPDKTGNAYPRGATVILLDGCVAVLINAIFAAFHPSARRHG